MFKLLGNVRMHDKLLIHFDYVIDLTLRSQNQDTFSVKVTLVRQLYFEL